MRSSITTLIISVSLLAVPGEASGSGPEPLSELCSASTVACDYASEDAPVFAAEVCWDGVVATLPGMKGCLDQREYWLDFGELDPATGVVQGYIPVPDACEAGHCVDKIEPDTDTEEMPICCTATNVCFDEICDGHIYWCNSGVSNEDGTITCLEGHLIV